MCNRSSKQLSERGLCTNCELKRVETEGRHDREANKEYMKMNLAIQSHGINALQERTANLDENVRGLEVTFDRRVKQLEDRVEENARSTQQSVNKLDQDVTRMQNEIEKLKLQLEIEQMKLAQKQEETKKEEALAQKEIETLKLAQKKEETKQAEEKTKQNKIMKDRDVQIEEIKKDRDIIHVKLVQNEHYSERQSISDSINEVANSNENLPDYISQQEYPTNWTRQHKLRTSFF